MDWPVCGINPICNPEDKVDLSPPAVGILHNLCKVQGIWWKITEANSG